MAVLKKKRSVTLRITDDTAQLFGKVARTFDLTLAECVERLAMLGLDPVVLEAIRAKGWTPPPFHQPVQRVCIIPGCPKPERARGMCTTHYTRWHYRWSKSLG